MQARPKTCAVWAWAQSSIYKGASSFYWAFYILGSFISKRNSLLTWELRGVVDVLVWTLVVSAGRCNRMHQISMRAQVTIGANGTASTFGVLKARFTIEPNSRFLKLLSIEISRYRTTEQTVKSRTQRSHDSRPETRDSRAGTVRAICNGRFTFHELKPIELFSFRTNCFVRFLQEPEFTLGGIINSFRPGHEKSMDQPCAHGIKDEKPDHLLVLVHGIFASPSDWRYVEAELKRRLGRHFLIYASSSNTYSKTFAGIDGAGKRLADEVKQLVKSRESLKRISILAHSLGGLIARYAVGVLYTRIDRPNSTTDSSLHGMIAGLEAINFITLATPHLGVRGNKQLPFLLGVPILEKIAAPMAPIFVGRTGSQLFLTDGKPDKPPLLLRMTTDSQDADFISALGVFKHRILYANASYDHMVGRRTSSIRRESELIKPPFKSLDGYKHVVDVEYCPPVLSTGSSFPPEAARAKEAAQNVPNTQNTLEYHEIMEEEMMRGLQQLGWKKVDVSFHSSLWPFFAHNNIHVKDEWFHKAGAGVVAHVADTINQQEKQHQTSSLISAGL